MQKQAAFIFVMSANPDVLLLDEPIDGLDPLVRKVVFEFIIEDVAQRGLTVLISSHNLKEMDGICDAVGIISLRRIRGSAHGRSG
jgi:ABC-2 type transport system ATP-binding protein